MAELVLNPASEKAIDLFLARPSHAVLLSGSKGLGKTHLAADMAARLLGAAGSAALANQPYYRELAPVKGVITIAQVRELIGFFRLAVPGAAVTKRVAVLQDADAMGGEAQNALLKLLEEPPAGSVLLLTSSHAAGLLPTVRSRLQTISIKAPVKQTLRAHFETLGYGAVEIDQALLRSGESIAEAHELLGGEVADADATVDLIKQVLGGDTYERLLQVDALAKQKEATMHFVDVLVQVATVSIDNAATHQAASFKRWHTVLQAAYTAQVAMAANGNPKLVLTDLMLSI